MSRITRVVEVTDLIWIAWVTSVTRTLVITQDGVAEKGRFDIVAFPPDVVTIP